MTRAAAVSVSQASYVAANFLRLGRFDCENPDPDGPHLEGRSYSFLAGAGGAVYEFPLVKNGEPNGYVLISGSRDVQPILDYCMTGPSLTESLDTILKAYLDAKGIDAQTVNWVYLSCLDILANVICEDGVELVLSIPDFRLLDKSVFGKRAQAVGGADAGWIAERWTYYEAQEPIVADALPCSTMFGLKPIKYNQTCQSSLSKVKSPKFADGTTNYCTPTCIVGCVATGWAVLASTWEGFDATGHLFSDAPDWERDWPSCYGPPPVPASPAVNRHMWATHSAMSTSCSGETGGNQTIQGSRFFSDYGVPWTWGFRTGVDYGFASSVNKAGQPFLLTAQAIWQQGQGVDGHAVVVHGYNDFDQHLSVCLGWGSYFADRWIPFSMLSDVSAFYVHSMLDVTKSGSAGLEGASVLRVERR